MSDTFTVERTISIAAPAAEIYPHIVDLREWPAWSPWEEMDPNMEKTFSGPETGVGSSYAWKGNRKVGEGRMTISGVADDARVDIDLEFLKPFKAENDTVFSLEPQGESTVVTWSMTGKKTLMTKIIGIFKSMDAMVGPDFEKGLASLKRTVES